MLKICLSLSVRSVHGRKRSANTVWNIDISSFQWLAAGAVVRWGMGNCPQPPTLPTKCDMEHALTNSQHRHTGAKSSVRRWPSKNAKMRFWPGLYPDPAVKFTTPLGPPSRLGVVHPSPYPTPLGAFGATIFPPSALDNRRLDLGVHSPKYIFFSITATDWQETSVGKTRMCIDQGLLVFALKIVKFSMLYNISHKNLPVYFWPSRRHSTGIMSSWHLSHRMRTWNVYRAQFSK